jgi:hypothetical protein
MVTSLNNRIEQVEREDLVMFINACLACTGQKEFYNTAYGQRVSIDFLHDYILGNYRLLYARTLAAGINHFNQAQIILKLLATGHKTCSQNKEEEGALIAAALKQLPSQRAWGVLQELKRRKINNRRSRAIAKEYLQQRSDLNFDAVKYRSKVRAIASHAHLKLPGEMGNFLFKNWQQKIYETELFEHFRQAHYSAKAIYELPLTVAEGLAIKHQIPRHLFLERIQERMTLNEKLRYQNTAEQTKKKVDLDLDFSKLPMTRLALYILSLPIETRKEKWEEFDRVLEKSAYRTLKKAPMKLRRVAAVLDCSYSSSGSSQKRRRPLGVALASHYFLKAAAQEYRAFWTVSVKDALLVRPYGQTDLATPLLMALEWGADSIVIISDGCENDPPRGASEILRVYRTKLDPAQQTSIVHCNPVFNSDNFSLRPLSAYVPTVGLRDAEDLPTMLGFARFADGSASLAELEIYLAQKVKQLLEKS